MKINSCLGLDKTIEALIKIKAILDKSQLKERDFVSASLGGYFDPKDAGWAVRHSIHPEGGTFRLYAENLEALYFELETHCGVMDYDRQVDARLRELGPDFSIKQDERL